MRRAFVYFSLALAVVLFATACSTSSEDDAADESEATAGNGSEDDDSDDGTGTEPDDEASAEPTDAASEPAAVEGSTTGIDAETVKVAAIVADWGALAETGLAIDIGDEVQQYQVAIDEVNDNGGIDGRMIELSSFSFDVQDETTQVEACLRATQDEEVFLVIASGGFQAEATACITEQNETLAVINSSVAGSFYERSGERLFSQGPSQDRAARAWAQLVHDAGELEGQTVGVVHQDDPTQTEFVENGLLATLDELGVDVAEVVALPCETRQCEQHENAVELFKAADVTAVFAGLGPLALPTFVSAADPAGFSPQYFVWDQATTATVSQLLESVSEELGAAVGVSRFALPTENRENPAFVECNDVFTERTGIVWDADTATSPDIDKFNATGTKCITVNAIVDAMRATGDNLNQRSFSLALQDTGEIPYTFPASWSEGKYDAADGFRLLRYNPACYADDTQLCWVPDSDEFTIVE